MTTGNNDEKLAFSIDEVANLLGISRNLAYECARKGQIPTIKLGRRLIVPRQALEKILALGGISEE